MATDLPDVLDRHEVSPSAPRRAPVAPPLPVNPAGVAAGAPAPALAASLVQGFVAQVLQGQDAALRATVERLREQGASVTRVYLELLAPTARSLGLLWDQDRCDFPGVTVGLGRLQRLLRELGPDFEAEIPSPAWPRPGPRLLLTSSPREQHGFGLSMVAAFFRRGGFTVEGGNGGIGPDPVPRAQAEHYDAVGISVGSLGQLGWVRERLAGLRLLSRNPALVVLLGGPLLASQPESLFALGADACVADAREAAAVAARLLAARSAGEPWWTAG